MPQLSLYVDDDTMLTLRESARGEGVSMSRYAANLIRERSQYGGWPQGYWENVYGCLDDDSFVVPEDLPADGDDSCDWFEVEANVPA